MDHAQSSSPRGDTFPTPTAGRRTWGRRSRVLALALAGLLAGPAIAQDATWPTKPRPVEKKPPEKKPAEKKPAEAAPVEKAPETERERLRREATGLFGPRGGSDSEQPNPKGETGGTGPAGWTIVLAVFRGQERESASRVMLQRVRDEGGLPEAFSVRRNDAVVVALGDFAGPDDPGAREQLARVQALAFGGGRPYQQAFFSPPIAGKMEGLSPQYNLSRAKEIYGDAAIYTLQVGVYGRLDLKSATEKDLAEARKAAEIAAFKLRQEGELAFYYHTPQLSMVTVGVFDLTDFDPQTPGYQSSRLRELRRRFPYNLYNGAGIKQRSKAAGESMQTSSLVALPGK